MCAPPIGCNRPTGAQLGLIAARERYLDAAQSFDAHPGLLGDTLQSAGTRAIAGGPCAVIAVATSDGEMAGPYLGRPLSRSGHDQKCGPPWPRGPIC